VRRRPLAAALLLAACGTRSTATTSLGAAGDIDVPRGFAYERTQSAHGRLFHGPQPRRTADTLDDVRSPLARPRDGARQRLEADGEDGARGQLVIARATASCSHPAACTSCSSCRPVGREGRLPALTLRFRHSGDVTVTLPVRAYGTSRDVVVCRHGRALELGLARVPGVWLVMALLATGYILWRRRVLGHRARRVARAAPRVVRAGWLLVWAALDWPIGALGGGYLASMHTVQWLLLSQIARPSFSSACPRPVARRSLPRLGAVLRAMADPLPGLLLFNSVCW